MPKPLAKNLILERGSSTSKWAIGRKGDHFKAMLSNLHGSFSPPFKKRQKTFTQNRPMSLWQKNQPNYLI